MICLARQTTSFFFIALAGSQIHDSVCQGTQNHRFRLPGRATTSMIFVCRGSQNHRFVLPSRAQKSVLWIARALKINDFGRPGGLPNARFCMPRQAQCMILLALASSPMHYFGCLGGDVVLGWGACLWGVGGDGFPTGPIMGWAHPASSSC